MEFYSTIQVYRPGQDRISFDTNPTNAARMLAGGQAVVRGNDKKKIKRLELVPSLHDTDERRPSRGAPGLIGQSYSFNELLQKGGHAWRHKRLPVDTEIEDPVAAERFVRGVFVRVQLECLVEA